MQWRDIKLYSVCIGPVQQLTIGTAPEPTSFVKKPVRHKVMALAGGLAGDTLGTGRRMGVSNHAVYVMPAQTHEFWRGELSRPGLGSGGLGENIIVDCPNEKTVSIGDRIEIGRAELTVIQPRIPCYKLAHFLGMAQSFPYRFLKSGRTGFYCAVTRPGEIRRGDKGRWVAAAGPRIAISRFVELTQFSADRAAITRLLDNEHIITPWKDKICERLVQLERAAKKTPGNGWLNVRCDRVADEGNDIKSFHLHGFATPPDTAKGGQFITVRRAIGGRDVIRNYSISAPAGSGAVAPGCVRISVKHERGDPGPAGLMSSALHQNTVCGDTLSVRAPQGHFILPERGGGGKIMLASGGIGITPMLGMLWQAAIEGRQERIFLVHTHRAEGDFPFAAELARLSARLANLRVELFDSGGNGGTTPGPAVRRGRPDWAARFDAFGGEGLVYVCGPGGMIEAVVAAARARGFAENKIIRETFGTLAAPASGNNARVSLARSGRVELWTPGDGSLLDFVTGRGIDVDHSCRSGICGTCAVPLLAGKIAYPDGFEAETANGNEILLCSAIPDGDVVLDI
jgi:ferredoxin-NADP reductase/MOSC domain-containing protein YiiM